MRRFRQFAEIYKERYVFAKALAIGKAIEYRLRPIIEHFLDQILAEIRTADIEDFIADLRKPKIAGRRKKPRTLSPASINRTVEIECLPTQIPGSIDADVTALGIGDSVHVRDLVIPNAEVLTDADVTIATVVPPTKALETQPGEGGKAEPEVIAKGKTDEAAAAKS